MAHLGVRFRLSVFHPRSLCRSASAQTRGNRVKTYSIRQILALIVFSLVIPACLIAIGFSAKAYYDGRDSVTTSTLQTAHALTLVVERELFGLQSATATLAFSPHLQNGDLAAFHAQARDVLRATVGFAFVLTDRSGQQLVNTSRPYGSVLPRHTPRIRDDRMSLRDRQRDAWRGAGRVRNVAELRHTIILNGEDL